MMSGALSLRGHDVPCRSVFGAELPFPDTEYFADAEFLIGGNRPLSVIQLLDLSAARCLRCRLELMFKHRPKLKILVTMSTAIATAIAIATATAIAIAIAMQIWTTSSGTIGGASGTTSATISSNQYNRGAN
jgi:hypothetical protein